MRKQETVTQLWWRNLSKTYETENELGR